MEDHQRHQSRENCQQTAQDDKPEGVTGKGQQDYPKEVSARMLLRKRFQALDQRIKVIPAHL